MRRGCEIPSPSARDCMTMISTLCHIVDGNRLLLIKKKRGLGQGKWNAPGGKIEEDEDILENVKKEVKEETGLDVSDIEKFGELEFYYGQEGDNDWLVHVFRANKFNGNLAESEETKPEWFHIHKIPFDEMWADDSFWLPILLKGNKFKGKFYFDKDVKNLLRYELIEGSEEVR